MAEVTHAKRDVRVCAPRGPEQNEPPGVVRDVVLLPDEHRKRRRNVGLQDGKLCGRPDAER